MSPGVLSRRAVRCVAWCTAQSLYCRLRTLQPVSCRPRTQVSLLSSSYFSVSLLSSSYSSVTLMSSSYSSITLLSSSYSSVTLLPLKTMHLAGRDDDCIAATVKTIGHYMTPVSVGSNSTELSWNFILLSFFVLLNVLISSIHAGGCSLYPFQAAVPRIGPPGDFCSSVPPRESSRVYGVYGPFSLQLVELGLPL